MTMTFEEYLEDVRDLHAGLLTADEMAAERKAYNALLGKITKGRSSLSDKALDARAVAKMFGGKALTGTARQKEWSETIRAEKLREMSEKQAVMACDPNGLAKTAKFWIENRARSGSEFGAFIEQQKEMLREYKAAHAARDHDEVARIAPIYNTLTTQWGF